LRTGGLVISGLVFLFGSLIAWFAWTQRARPFVFHAPKYHPPISLIAAGLLTIALLTLASWLVRGFGRVEIVPPRKAPNPWQVAMGTFLLALPWWVLISLVFIPKVAVPFGIRYRPKDLRPEVF
jgi:hypothetical protein